MADQRTMEDRAVKNEGIKKTFTVTGMTCATCAKTVEKALRKLDGVKFAAVNLATSTGFIVAERELSFEEIKKAVEEVGYGISTESPEDVERKRYEESKKNLILAWLVTAPLALLMIYHMFVSKVPYFTWIEVFAGAFVTFYVGRGTIRGAWIALTHKHTNMDTLIFFGAVTSWVTAVLDSIGLPVMSFGAIGAMIVAFHITGRFIESYLRDRASKEIKALLKLQAKEARVITDEGEVMMPIEAVKEDFIVLVKPGERIPVDGVIVEGQSSIDESVVTGESIPVLKRENDEVIGGSLNVSSPIKIKVAKVGEDTFLSQMIKLIQEAQGSKVPIQALADRITMWFVPTIIVLAIASALVWYFNYEQFLPFVEKAREIFPWIIQTSDPLTFSIFVFVATIVIACPCALGLATPMALVTGTGLAAKKGLLIRNAEAIQTSKDIGVVLTDKTGTLTEGSPRVVDHNLSDELVRIVASVERNSNHPLAKAISELSQDVVEIENVEEIPGEGVRALYKGEEYFVGKPQDYSRYESLLEEGKTVVEVRRNGEVVGFLAIEDPIREDSPEAVRRLKEMGIEPVMITGDNEKTARAVARRLGIEKFHAGVKPSEKLDLVRYYQAQGKKVAMVGDGMNDAAALKGADVGIAIGSGTDLAIDSADIIITKGGISKVVDAIEISRKTFKIIKQNLFWAFFYNVVAIPMAMMGLLHPVIAELAMAFSSITVTLNSMRVRE
ncbi:heavy metal translocating P-type ATPase [Thermotoga sp. 38H-to]|uniref:heavy metal translocating P-type ATPase n=1 Tax=Thermotoga sp. 38H-to TaxID=1755812 RepID=UPI0013ED682B|nr:heavy metal translocating P-type ATPase [Thermotoga sp. 38H-to]KAF2959502.1 ATPase P [Thermotoga sp. 38H-to]